MGDAKVVGRIGGKALLWFVTASLLVVAAVPPTFGLPEAGLLLILGIDPFLDMGRTGTNVIGKSIATAVVAKWEGVLGPPRGDAEALRAIVARNGWRTGIVATDDRQLAATGGSRSAQ